MKTPDTAGTVPGSFACPIDGVTGGVGSRAATWPFNPAEPKSFHKGLIQSKDPLPALTWNASVANDPKRTPALRPNH
jgi:hypothetical protein